MQERPNTVDAGLRLSGPRFLPLDTGIEVRGDTFGAYDGLVTSLDLGWRFRYQKGMFRPFIRTEWLSPKLAEHLYGVRPDEVLPDRPAYSPDGSWQISLDSLLVHAFDNRWEFTASAGLVFLDSEATESPIVDKSTLWRTMAGFGYRF
jgi:outer membrane protein